MSFSQSVKEELLKQEVAARHCNIAEIAAIIGFCGKSVLDSNNTLISIRIVTENQAVARKYFTLIKKTFNINTKITIRSQSHVNNHNTYILEIGCIKQMKTILKATKLINENEDNMKPYFDGTIYQQSCCRRAFLRGAFLSVGSVSNPNKTYHFEMVTQNEDKARQLQIIINSFDLVAKVIIRKKYYVVYLKEGSQIVDILNIMGAHVALMELENVRIFKEMRNSVNRQVNCETANINKTVSAACKQIEDIHYIQNTVGLNSLSESLLEIAELRLQYPEETLVELGKLLSNPLGKSGVNHRFRKIGEIAETIRDRRGELRND